MFRIYEDYETTVGNRKKEFEEDLRKQLALILRTEISNVRNLRTWPGSVEVSFNLVAPSELDAGEHQQAMAEFSELIASGKLDLKNLDGGSMNVPMQCVQNCPVEAIGKYIHHNLLLYHTFTANLIFRRGHYSYHHRCSRHGNCLVYPHLHHLCCLHEEEENRGKIETFHSKATKLLNIFSQFV